jgi:hypothetical protein
LPPRGGFDRAARPGVADKAKIDLGRFDELVNAIRMLVLHADVRLGIGLHEPLDKVIHVRKADRIDRGDTYAAGDFFVQRPDLLFKGVIALDELAAAFVIGFPFRRKNEWAFSPVNELHAQVLFQPIHNLTSAGLGNAIFAGRAGKTSPPHNVAKDLEGFQVRVRRRFGNGVARHGREGGLKG